MSQPTSFRTEFTIENFFRKLKEEGSLSAARCEKCNFKMIPPRPICSRCLSCDLEWVRVPARGKIVSFSEVHVSSENFQRLLPYVVCIASFGDDLKIPGILKEAKNVKVGSEVEIEIQPDKKPEYVFALSSADRV